HRVRLLLLGWGGARTGSQAVKRPERGDSRDEPDEGAKTKCRVVHISPRRCTEKCGGSGSREAVRCAQFEPAVAATALSRRERWDEIEHHTARRPPLDLAAGAFRDHRVLAESGTAERTVEAELAQHRQRVGGRLPGDLIARGNRATGGGLHEAKAHSPDFDAIDPILGPGREPGKNEVRPEALHRDG